ncbi:hypothetical protein A2U01_0101648, partial [Trifolium medium]|nr:hypothetical protein [Trifolium medium]
MEGDEEHVMNTDEFINSSAEYEHTTRLEDSHDDEGTSVSKPPSRICLPAEVLQSLKN